jgi:drug/metabolite transporter (DMT)-like permease
MQAPNEPAPEATSGRASGSRTYQWSAIALGIGALSTASILIRLAQAPALAIGAWRMLLATLILTPWAWPRVRRELPKAGRRALWLVFFSGCALAVHFATWITSLMYTTVASSAILVTTNPIYVALASYYLFKEPIGRRRVYAIGIAMLGSVVVGMGDIQISPRALLGDALALLGALAASSYILLGRAVRRRLSTLAYIWPCYGIAALLLLLTAIATGAPLTGYGADTWIILLLLAVGPQIIGHSMFNWALAHFTPIFVTLAILGEPVGAILLARLILHENPPLTALLGGLLIICGIVLASREEIRARQNANANGAPGALIPEKE